MLRFARRRSLNLHNVGSFSISSTIVRNGSNPKLENIQSFFRILPDFITEADERFICDEIEPLLSHVPYNENHWDRAITHYREIERREWDHPQIRQIINRVKSTVFDKSDDIMEATHCLDLADHGVILPHVDSVKFVGRALASISLLSDSVMRLRLVEAGFEIFGSHGLN